MNRRIAALLFLGVLLSALVADAGKFEDAKDLTERFVKAGVIAKITGLWKKDELPKVWVDPNVWGAMNYDQKMQFTMMVGVYTSRQSDPDRFNVEIINNMNGKKIAKWNMLGFKVY